MPLETAPTATPTAGTTEPARHRDVFWPGQEKWITTAVYDGAPAVGLRIEGPALVQLPHTTIAVASGQSLETDDYAELHPLTPRSRRASMTPSTRPWAPNGKTVSSTSPRSGP